MRLRRTKENPSEVHDFISTISKCNGCVYLKSPYGDVYNLKSEFSMYIGLGALLSEHGDELEVFCDDKSDEKYFYKFFEDHPGVLM